jgi:hypothetical protein
VGQSFFLLFLRIFFFKLFSLISLLPLDQSYSFAIVTFLDFFPPLLSIEGFQYTIAKLDNQLVILIVKIPTANSQMFLSNLLP